MNRRKRRWLEKTTTGMKAGTFVTWPSSNGKTTSKGRVVSVHTGKVPGVIGMHTATADAPAARVQVYAKTGDGYEPTTVHVAHDVASLSTIGELAEPSMKSKVAEAVAGSFDDIRSCVEDAICDRIESLTGVEDCSIYVADIGFTWAVYMVNWGDDLWMIDYSIDTAGTVTLGDPIEVCRVTSYVPDMDPVDAATGMTLTETVRHEGRLLGSLGSDTAGGRVFEVQIIAYGDSKNGRRYPESVMRAAAPLYEGAKAYDHHRTDAELNTGTVVGIIGDYRNVQATETGLKAELHLLPSATHAAELLDRTLANQSSGLPALVGISHDVMTQSKPIQINGRQGREVTAVTGVNSADVVADPAAGGAAMRMVANLGDSNQPKEINVNLKQLLALFRAAESAKRPALLAEHAQIIEAHGFTVEEFAREVENVTTPMRDSEGVYTKGSAMADVIVDTQIGKAGIDARFSETVTADLPDKFTESDLATAIARTKRTIEAAGLVSTGAKVPGTDTTVTVDEMDKKKAALDAFFDQNWSKGYTSFKEAYLDITGYRGNGRDILGEDFNRRILQESALVPGGGLFDSMRNTESATSSTWSLILGDSITRHMVQEYNRASFQDWRKLVNIFPVNDFRTQRVDRLGVYAVLPTVNQGAPYNPLTTPANEEATYAPTKRGGTEDLTLEAIANDDIRLISRLPERLGFAAAITVYKFVMDFFIAPITATYDSTATFAAGHGNTDTNALSDSNLSAGRVKMLKQSELSGTANFLPIVPRYLLAPPDLWQLANVLTRSAVAVPSAIAAASNVVNLNQDLETIIVPYWTATSTTAWFLAADPAQTPAIEMGFYQGKTDPDLFVQSDQTVGSMFDADKVTYKLRHIYGGTLVDHRGVYRGNT